MISNDNPEQNPSLLQDSIYFAYFPPYSYVRHQELIAHTHAKKNVRLDVIGETLDGHDLDVLRIGESRNTHAQASSITRPAAHCYPACS